MLAALGLGPAEEEIYRLLVAGGRAAVHELAVDGGRPESETRDILAAPAGLTDQAVGARLGVSRRTVQRRIGELMARAGVESRIQLGRYAARKGWA